MPVTSQVPSTGGALRPTRRGPRVAPAATAWLDLARISAMLAVVVVHVLAPVVSADSTDIGTSTWWTGNAVDAAVRWCVPVFIMISGALLLRPREESLPHFYRRRFSRIGVPLVVWTGAYLVWEMYRDGTGLHDVARDVLSGSPSMHLYFLFVLAGLYVLTPFLRVLVQHASVPTLWWFAGLMSVIGMADQFIAALDGVGEPNAVTRFLPYIGYYVMGYLLREVRLGRRGVLAVGAVLLVSVATTAIGVRVLAKLDGGWGDYPAYLYDYLSPTVLVMAVTIYLLFRAIGGRLLGHEEGAAPMLRRHLRRVSDLSFGVFLMHVMVLLNLRDLTGMPGGPFAMLSVAVFQIVAAIGISMVLTALFKRIPGLRATV